VAEKFKPQFLKVRDDSEKHRHHHQSPGGGNSHFDIVIVSTQFEKVMLVNRHREANALLDPFMKQGVHALGLHLYTPEEWDQKSR